MGRFARSQDVATSTGHTRRPEVIAVPSFLSKRERRSHNMKRQALRLYEMRAKGMRYFWLVLVSITGLSAGWVMGQSWINPEQVPTQVASITPSAYGEPAVKDRPQSEVSAGASGPAVFSDKDSNFIDPNSQPNQASDYDDRKPGKAHRSVARVSRVRAQEGAVSMVLKPFKAINPLKLRKLRPW